MTRINVVPVRELTREQLIAEYREIARIPGYLKKSLKRTGKPFDLSEIPDNYTLGTGHVKFFYDKMLYLKKRHTELVEEMIRRGYKPTYTDTSIYDVGREWQGAYRPTKEAMTINRERLKQKNKKK